MVFDRRQRRREPALPAAVTASSGAALPGVGGATPLDFFSLRRASGPGRRRIPLSLRLRTPAPLALDRPADGTPATPGYQNSGLSLSGRTNRKDPRFNGKNSSVALNGYARSLVVPRRPTLGTLLQRHWWYVTLNQEATLC